MDPIDAWQETYERVVALVADLPEEALSRPVPACPDWSVADLLAHVIGLGADVLGGDEPDDHRASWTQAQVEARRGRGRHELLAEWHQVSGPLREWMREHGSRPLNDVVIHEQDLRGAVQQPGGRDGAGVAIVRDRRVEKLAVAVAGLPAIELRGESWSWASGADAGVLVEASDFDLFRALTTRRTAEQLRSWTTRGDVTAYLDAFAGLGPLPQVPLAE